MCVCLQQHDIYMKHMYQAQLIHIHAYTYTRQVRRSMVSDDGNERSAQTCTSSVLGGTSDHSRPSVPTCAVAGILDPLEQNCISLF